MRAIQIHHLKLSIITSFVLLTLLSCKVQLVPTYDESIKSQIETTTQEIDHFYLALLEVKKSEAERQYAASATEYIEIQVQLNSLLRKNKARELNDETVKIIENTLKLWVEYKSRHEREGTIDNVDIQLNMKGMEAMMFSLLIAEIAKENAK